MAHNNEALYFFYEHYGETWPIINTHAQPTTKHESNLIMGLAYKNCSKICKVYILIYLSCLQALHPSKILFEAEQLFLAVPHETVSLSL